MEYLERTSTSKVFFGLFNVKRIPESGPDKTRQGHIGFRSKTERSYFLSSNDSNKNFKLIFLFVQAMNGEAKRSIASSMKGCW